jgi:O-6-methylguanine DNA methyltransferase
MDTSIYYSTHKSRIGTLVMVASHRGFRYVNLLPDDTTPAAFLSAKKEYQDAIALDGFFTSSINQIDGYLNGISQLKLPVDLATGTALQRSVWLAIARIPYGQTISYTELAERVGFPRAVRAVASACGANPIPLIIPCHRVVAKDGTLGGFSLGGLGIKELLLGVENGPLEIAA